MRDKNKENLTVNSENEYDNGNSVTESGDDKNFKGESVENSNKMVTRVRSHLRRVRGGRRVRVSSHRRRSPTIRRARTSSRRIRR